MTPNPTDPPATLTGIRERIALVAAADLDATALNDVYAAMVRLARDDSAVLLAAVEAVLNLHQQADRGAGARCKGCATHVTFTPWPCPTYRAITTALAGTGEEGSDEG